MHAGEEEALFERGSERPNFKDITLDVKHIRARDVVSARQLLWPNAVVPYLINTKQIGERL